jgi:DNA-binding transcriptional regulator LsrR (DeoR family)
MNTIEYKDMEIWKEIPGYSRYQASNLGRIRSMNYKGRKQLAEKYGVSQYTIKELVTNRKNRKNSWEHVR